MEHHTFKVGTWVKWTSQSGGHETTKRGQVILSRPSGRWMDEDAARLLNQAGITRFRRCCDYFGPVVVLVPRRHKRTGALITPAIYSPRVGHLELTT